MEPGPKQFGWCPHKGQVWYQGQPLTGGMVVFTPDMQRGDLIHAWLRQIAWIEDGLPDADALVKSSSELSAGLDRAEGEAVVIMDADPQRGDIPR